MHRFTRLPRSVLLIAVFGLAAFAGFGTSRAAAQDKGVIVPVSINGSQILEMSKKQRIKDIDNKDQNVARVDFVQGADFRKVMVVAGGTSGFTRLVLTDNDGNKEVFDIVIEVGVEFLKRVLGQAVPTANIQFVQGAGGALILTGSVMHASDIDIIYRTAVATVGDPNRVINALRIGGIQQVQLDVVIARVARSEARSMGFNFLENGNNHFVGSAVDAPGSFATTLTNSVGNLTTSLSGSPNIAFGIFNGNQAFLGFLNALRTESLVKLLDQPSLCTTSGKPALLTSGGKQAVPTIASGGAGGGAVSGIDFVPFGTTIKFMPLVLGNGKIYLEVEPAFDFPDPSNLFSSPVSGTSGVVFGRTTQSVQTAVTVEDGQTLAIGGMIFHSVNGSTAKIPVLGDLPFLGTAFSTISYSDSEEELLILVTPHLIDPMSCDQVPKCLPGMETRKPDDFELFLERILEAPRGPRQVFHGNTYVPAYKNSPTAGMYPCPNCNGPRGACDFDVPAGPACPPGGCLTGNCVQNTWNGSIPAGVSPMPVQLQTPVPAQPAVTVPMTLQQQTKPAVTVPMTPPQQTKPAVTVPMAPQQLEPRSQPQAKVDFAPIHTVPVDVLPPATPTATGLPMVVPAGSPGIALVPPAAVVPR